MRKINYIGLLISVVFYIWWFAWTLFADKIEIRLGGLGLWFWLGAVFSFPLLVLSIIFFFNDKR